MNAGGWVGGLCCAVRLKLHMHKTVLIDVVCCMGLSLTDEWGSCSSKLCSVIISPETSASACSGWNLVKIATAHEATISYFLMYDFVWQLVLISYLTLVYCNGICYTTGRITRAITTSMYTVQCSSVFQAGTWKRKWQENSFHNRILLIISPNETSQYICKFLSVAERLLSDVTRFLHAFQKLSRKFYVYVYLSSFKLM